MKIVVALENEAIKDKLDDIYPGLVYIHDINYMEGLIQYLSKEKDSYIIITKNTLPGNLNDKLYIKQLRLASPTSKIIYIVDKLDDEYKSFLFANEVFSIIEGNNIKFETLKNVIEEDKGVVYKTLYNDDMKLPKLNEPAVCYDTQNQLIFKQLIAFYGTSGSGKSSCSSIIAKNIANELNISVSLLDMDIQNPSIDIINNLDGNNNILSQIVDNVDKREEINNVFTKYMIKDKKHKNLSYMTSNCSIFDCQNRFQNKYYQKIYDSARNNFDYTIIDLPSTPFLDVVPYTLSMASKIFFVINPNYISIRQAIKYLDLMTKLWDISKEKIGIIVNKIEANSLDISQIKSLLNDYEIVAQIEENKNMQAYINGAIGNLKQEVNMDKIYESVGIKKQKSKLTPIRSLILNKYGGKKVDNKSF